MFIYYRTTLCRISVIPCVFIHDGQIFFDVLTSFSEEWGVDEIADSLSIRMGLSCIVLGINNGGCYRIEELTPWPNRTMKQGEKGRNIYRIHCKDLKTFNL